MTQAHEVLQHVFGYDSFREPQEAIIDTLVNGGDALVLMPTGGGKSLCYQIPALVRPGCAIVVSPLIALMQDQVDALQQLGVSASFLNSTLDPATAAEIEQSLLSGELDLLYVAPERLLQARTLQLLSRSQLSLFAIDEAHCVSQWGHDFRADYLALDQLAVQFPTVPRIALTATADQRTRGDIATRLGLNEAAHFIAGFDRPNIRYRLALKNNPRQQLLRFLRDEHSEDAGIVYCLSRKKVDDTAAWLCSQGLNALPYHAGMDAGDRQRCQQRFLREEGIIVVATIAFGMGIDKPDVRFVAHLDMPRTIESYYQETGRAGRDGEPADAWLLYGLQDVIKLRQMMAGSRGDEQHRRAEQQRLNAMLGLCEVTSCRRQVLLRYFDEQLNTPCGNCDNCLNPPQTWDGTEAARKALSAAYRSGQRFGVNHLIDVLRGNAADKVIQFDHHLLPTFGVGKELDANQWRSVFRQLVARGLLNVDMEGYGALQLTPACRALLRGEEQLELRRDNAERGTSRQTRGPLPDDLDVELWEALREQRRLLAEGLGVPPYVVFHDKTLQEMCRQQPANLDEFGALPGVGDRKRERYGPGFLEVLGKHARA